MFSRRDPRMNRGRACTCSSGIPGLVLDLNGDIGVTGSAGTLAWTDQSGRGNTATALAGSLGLTYSASDAEFNNHGAVTFNGTNDAIVADAVATAISGLHRPMYAICVIREVVASNPATFWCFSGASNGLWRFQAGAAANWSLTRRNDANVLNSSTVSVTTPNTTQSHILEVTWDGLGQVSMWDNGVQNASNVTLASPDPCTLNALRIGANTNPQFGNFKLARMQVYAPSSGASASGRASLRAALRSLYGTP